VPDRDGLGVTGDGWVAGYVFDNSTGAPIENAKMSASGIVNYTDSNGFYNMTVPIGEQYLIAIRDGYEISINLINVSLALGTDKNVSMVPRAPYLQNGTIHGFVTDSETNISLPNVTISIWGRSVITDSNGEYSIEVLQGSHVMVGIKDGYENYIGEVSVPRNNITEHNFSMTQLTGFDTYQENGTIRGTVRDNETLSPLRNVTISIAGYRTATNSTGQYYMRVPLGEHNLLAFAYGYNNHVANVTIHRNNDTVYDFNLKAVTEEGLGEGAGTGLGTGLGSGQGAGTGESQKKIRLRSQRKLRNTRFL